MLIRSPEDTSGGSDREYLNEPGTFLMLVKKWLEPKAGKDGRPWLRCLLEEVTPYVEGREPKDGRQAFFRFLWDERHNCLASGKDSKGMGSARFRDFCACLGCPVQQGEIQTDQTIGRAICVVFEAYDGKVYPNKFHSPSTDQIQDALDYKQSMWTDA